MNQRKARLTLTLDYDLIPTSYEIDATPEQMVKADAECFAMDTMMLLDFVNTHCESKSFKHKLELLPDENLLGESGLPGSVGPS